MLDIRYIQAHQEELLGQLLMRNFANPSKAIAAALEANGQRKHLQLAVDQRAQQLKQEAAAIHQLLRAGKQEAAAQSKVALAEKKEKQRLQMAALKEQEQRLKKLLLQLPNQLDKAVPEGNTPEDNVVCATWEGKAYTQVEMRPHWELLKQYNLASFEIGNAITGAGFPVYIGQGAKLQRSLIHYFIEEATAQGYVEVQPPLLVNEKAARGTGQLPDKEGIMYHVAAQDLYLIPTAEVPITNLHAGEVLEMQTLPYRYVSYTPCFRREAGSWGRHVRGLNRLHQFDKVELVQLCTPEQASEALKGMLKHVTNLLEALQLKYRVLKLCAGDLNPASAITYDVEVWSPGQQSWLEVSSVSHFLDYQARRMQLRYRQGKKIAYLHTLNGSALALPRIVAALLEAGQQREDISLPSPLHPYMGAKSIKKI
jgi:seryl-tRNA synthetase